MAMGRSPGISGNPKRGLPVRGCLDSATGNNIRSTCSVNQCRNGSRKERSCDKIWYEGGGCMRKIFVALLLGIFVFLWSRDISQAQDPRNAAESQFKVLNPWAEVDPITPRGISPRLNTLAGKKIGLFANFKRAARPIAMEAGKRLKTMYPDIETSLFDSRGSNVVETETKNREQFIAWVKGVDAVILAVGD